MDSMESMISSLQTYMSLAFFLFTGVFLIFALALKILRSSPWCSCDVCRAYASSSWTAEFDNLCDWYTHLLRLSPTRTIHIHILGNTITANPDNVEHMLKTRFDNFPKGKHFSTILGDLLGHGIFNVDGDSWLFQRKMASLELGSNSVRSYAARIVADEVHDRLLPFLSSVAGTGGVIDLQDVFRRFAFDSISKISFGLDRGCLELPVPMTEFAAAFDLASKLSAQRATATCASTWKVKRLFNWGSEKELQRAIRLVNVLAEEVIRQRRKLGFTENHDLLSRFMGSVNEGKYLRDIVISFLLAGRDTVASGLTSFFLELSKNTRVQRAIQDEINRVVRNSSCEFDQVVSHEHIKEMHYVHAALYETLRLYPPVQLDSKFCLEDDVLPDGTFVSKGTRVTYHPYAMGRMEDAWGPDCEVFRPERWLCNGVFKPENPFKFPVFQAGLRVCLGKEMAIMQMKTVIVSIVRAFDINVINETSSSRSRPPKFAPGLTASFASGLMARVSRRTSNDGTCSC
ncbi:Cytochrome P450 E-class group I protein [Dioscorea alata]|uniref:Cytochrome P450 E-class group I protein n=1 Tax=Dioscorea alata TaxID=55571 RepID=A0ACB7VCK6_DIOAL|nr:Cytochrome P450 E-class group I protein [Dioscorea alata]